jgi:hypothetical protein|uniref:Uncharacterized protein n=1 Tax=viral metagenome TaxID=1070528 RepID=A0A6C0AJJ9_9ZZZZ
MFHLVKDNVSGIENNLIWARSVRDSIISWWFNVILLVLVVGSFGYFLWASYGTAVPEELQKIPFEPNMWHNAVRNVPITDYGQTPQIEASDGLSRPARRNGAAAF